MKKILSVLLLSVASASGVSAQQSCNIQDHYEDFISVQKSAYGTTAFLLKQVTESPKESCVSRMVKDNPMFWDYLLTHFSDKKGTEALLEISDSALLRERYFANLRKDTSFHKLMTELQMKALERKQAKDTLSMDQLMNVAVKYFSILSINGEGLYVGKVCTGQNDIRKTETLRCPFVEAFCFAAILEHYQSFRYSMYQEFVQALQELYTVNFGSDPGERLLRAQGAMYMLMRRNENLQKMLKEEYQGYKEFLPFVLKTNP